MMKKKSQIEIERKIVSRVKREMERPRLTESVRNGFSARPHQPRRSLLPVRGERES